MTDRKTVLAVVILLGFLAIACVAGAVILVAFDKSVPDGLWTIGAGAAGALGAVLASTRTQGGEQPINVSVVNPPRDPVNVDPVK